MANSSAPKLTKAALAKTVEPHNGCAVKSFMENMDDESRAVLEEALAMKSRELGAPRIRAMLIEAGYDGESVPSIDQLKNHRARRETCKCPR